MPVCTPIIIHPGDGDFSVGLTQAWSHAHKRDTKGSPERLYTMSSLCLPGTVPSSLCAGSFNPTTTQVVVAFCMWPSEPSSPHRASAYRVTLSTTTHSGGGKTQGPRGREKVRKPYFRGSQVRKRKGQYATEGPEKELRSPIWQE